jgi:3-deoxy-manno-octulosonate cytidylyltransferase (CMP-KDO synthetase)
MSHAVVGVIPARLSSSRLPRKVLLKATGKFLIQHVYEAAAQASSLTRLLIAADSQEVVDACASFGAVAVLTDPDHPNGTSRLAEVAASLGLADDDIVVNVQGDEPDLDPHAIDAAVAALKVSPSCPVATIGARSDSKDDALNPAIVKVVRRLNGTALYFSRAAIPHHRVGATGAEPALRHVGLYVYRRWFLARYVTLAATPLEQTEMLEQLRILEHGFEIAVARFDCSGAGIDTPEQYADFVRRLAK